MRRTCLTAVMALLTAHGLSAPLAAQDKPLKEVTLMQAHPTVALGEDVFLYAVPLKMGWFAEEGIKLNLTGARGGSLSAQVLQSGDAQIASTDPAVIMSVREKGGSIKGFFALKRQPGYALATLKNAPVRKIEDLKGKIIGVQSLSSGVVPIIRGMMKDLGQSEGDYTLVAVGLGAQAASALVTKRIDALALWEAAFAAVENASVEMDYVEFPVIPKLAAFVLATTDSYLKSNPDVVAGVCRAIAKGIVFSLANPEAAVRIFNEVHPETKPSDPSPKAFKDDVNVFRKWLANGTGQDGSRPIGELYPEKWAFTIEYQKEAGRLSAPKPAADHYDLSFLPKCNDFDRDKVAAQARAM